MDIRNDISIAIHVERGSSVVERRTRNRVSPGSNFAAWLECFPEKPRTVSEWTGLSGKEKSVKRFERSNGLDTELYKNYLYLYSHWTTIAGLI